MKQMSPKHFQRHALSNIHMEHFIEDQESNVDSNGLLITDAIQTLVNKGMLFWNQEVWVLGLSLNFDKITTYHT